MGGPNFAGYSPGRTTATQQVDSHQSQQQGVVGKRTRVEAEAGRHGGAGSRNTIVQFLNGEQRGRVEALLLGRVLAAQITYTTVLAEMHAENLIQKKEDLDIWTSLFISALGAVGEYVIMAALKDLKKAGTAVKHLADAKVTEVKEKEIAEKILGVDEKHVEKLVGIGVDKGKEKGAEKATESKNEAGQEEQEAQGSYIDYLEDNSMMMFQHLREDKLASATDSELMTALVAFDGSHWTHTIVRQKLQAHINLYMSSHAKDIGHKIEHKKEQTDSGTETVPVRKEMRVAYVLNQHSGSRQMVYIAKEFKADANHGIGDGAAEMDSPGPAYTAPENALGLEEQGTWHDSQKAGGDTKQSSKPEAEPEFLGPVEPELQKAALAAHTKRWLQAPQVLFKTPYQWVVINP